MGEAPILKLLSPTAETRDWALVEKSRLDSILMFPDIRGGI